MPTPRAALLLLLLPLLAAGARTARSAGELLAEVRRLEWTEPAPGEPAAAEPPVEKPPAEKPPAEKPPADPKADGRVSAAKDKLDALRGSLEKLRSGLEGTAGMDPNGLRKSVQNMIHDICDCDVELPEDLSHATVKTILGGVDARLQVAEQALHAGSNLPVAQVIERKSVLRGVLLQIPPVRNSFSDTVVKFKPGVRPADLVDPRDARKKEFTSHFLSQRMSNMAAMAAMTFGSSSTEIMPGAGALVGAAGSVMGPIGSALALTGLMQAHAELTSRRETLSKEEVDLHVIWEPRGAVAIDFSDLELVEAAAERLEEIAGEDEKEVRRGLLVKFLRRYGSHVCHKVTLGGTRQRKAVLHTQAAVSSTEANLALKMAAKRAMAEEAASASVGGQTASAPSPESSLLQGAPIELGMNSGRGNLEDMVTIEKETNGGASDLPQGLWTGSLANNENWEIIDRHIRDCTPVWDFAHRDRKRFGKTIEKDLFQTWYREFLNLKEFSKKQNINLPDDFVSEEQLIDWIASQHQELEPSVGLYKQCDATGWCGGHGECGPETGGVCECQEDYQLEEGTCVAKTYPMFGGGCMAGIGHLFGGGSGSSGDGDSDGWNIPDYVPTLLELGKGEGGGAAAGGFWDDSFFFPWVQMVEGEDFAAKHAEVAHFEEAMVSIISDAETEAELVRAVEASIEAQKALVEIFGNQEYLRQLSRDAEDLAVILQLEGAEQYLKKLSESIGGQAASLETLLRAASSAAARRGLAAKLSLFAQRLGEAQFLADARSLLQRRMESLAKILAELKSGSSRQQVAELLSARARQLLAASSPAAGAAEASRCVPCEVKDTLLRRVLPLQRQASADLVAGLQDLQGGSAGP